MSSFTKMIFFGLVALASLAVFIFAAFQQIPWLLLVAMAFYMPSCWLTGYNLGGYLTEQQ